MPSRKTPSCPQTGARTWIRDCLHDLRDHAQDQGLTEADAALRDSIVRVSQEAGVATLLSVKDLLAYQASEPSSKALDT